MIFKIYSLDPFVYLTMLLTQESIDTIVKVLTSTSFKGFDAHISEECSCYKDDSQPCEVIQEGISFDWAMMKFTLSDACVFVEMFIDNERGDAEYFLGLIECHNGVRVEFSLLMKDGFPSSIGWEDPYCNLTSIITLSDVRQFLESL